MTANQMAVGPRRKMADQRTIEAKESSELPYLSVRSSKIVKKLKRLKM